MPAETTPPTPKHAPATRPQRAGVPGLPRELFIAALALAIFAAAFYATGFLRAASQEHDLDGFKIRAALAPAGVKPFLARVLANDPIRIELRLYPGEDPRNNGVGVLGAQVAGALSEVNKTAVAYGLVEGGERLNCNANTSHCQDAHVVVRIGDCNCLRLETSAGREQLVFEGQRPWLIDADTNNKVRGIVKLIVTETRGATDSP